MKRLETHQYPPVEDWVCIYCETTVIGGATHRCPK